ncbi:MAG TPA: antibiotic biosynthesis monooxygenase [Ktedonobacteraceae bacterium]|nr:antibiotic biosynthesis monooxygenase [Ktedonobacteraceae bacterium]
MELLVATLVSMFAERDTDSAGQIHSLADTLRGAPGLHSSRFYRNRGDPTCFLLLTTWEDTESWRQARAEFNPKTLLLKSASGMLQAQPEQWVMQYLWGYYRPAAPATLTAVHLATIRAGYEDTCQQGWVNGLRQQVNQSTLSSAFLARGRSEGFFAPPSVPSTGTGKHAQQHNPVFLNLFSWSTEAEHRALYTSPYYQALDLFIRNQGVMRVFPLEPI